MEIFYSTDIDGTVCRLNEEESGHCVRVLRHRSGDEIKVIDGKGGLYTCRITDDSPKHTTAQIISVSENCGALPYTLEIAACPTKNIDRYEWFAEKATEIGISSIAPVIGDRSERKIIKKERLEKIAVSASKQSLKRYVPEIKDATSVKEYVRSTGCRDADIKLIACCFEDETHPRTSITDAVRNYFCNCFPDGDGCADGRQQDGSGEAKIERSDKSGNSKGRQRDGSSEAKIESSGKSGSSKGRQQDSSGEQSRKASIAVLIGPEGDFSHEEVRLAIENGWMPVHLGSSRLRTETAALTAVETVYLCNMLFSDNLDLGVYTDLDD